MGKNCGSSFFIGLGLTKNKMADIITPAELIEQFEYLIDDSTDEDAQYRLMTQAKNKVEMELKLLILQDVDSTQISNSGDNYLSMKTLADDARLLLKLTVGTQGLTYRPVAFMDRESWKNAARRYYIKWKTRQFALTGTSQTTQVINQYFLSKTDPITIDDADDAAIIVWPDEFKPLIPYVMAGIVQANVDPDAITIAQALQQYAQGQIILDSFREWDTTLKLEEADNRGGFESDHEGPEGAEDGIVDLGNLGLM